MGEGGRELTCYLSCWFVTAFVHKGGEESEERRRVQRGWRCVHALLVSCLAQRSVTLNNDSGARDAATLEQRLQERGERAARNSLPLCLPMPPPRCRRAMAMEHTMLWCTLNPHISQSDKHNQLLGYESLPAPSHRPHRQDQAHDPRR